MTDRVVAWVRTVVPTLWATLLTVAVSRGLPESWADALSDVGTAILVPVAVGAVYAAARWLETRSWVPEWVKRALMGSTSTPSYTHVDGENRL